MRYAVRAVLPFLIGYFISYFIRTVNAVIAPELTLELGLTPGSLGALTSAYFLAFAIAQVPVGLLLDRYGPRRTEAALLLVAALGAVGFGLGHSELQLMLARALMGLGMAACLMATLKFAAQRFPLEQQPALTGMVMTSGGLGAVMSSSPMEMLLPFVGWRAIFFGVAALTVLVAINLYRSVEDVAVARNAPHLASPTQGLLQILRAPAFWVFVPVAVLATGGFMAIQGLWAVPWLMQVEGISRAAAARYQLLLSVAGLSGQLLIATFATRWLQRGMSQLHLMVGGLALAMLAQTVIAWGGGGQHLWWFLLGLAGSSGAQVYSLLAARFPLHLTGRVMSTINCAVFLGAFTVQWGFGVLVDVLQLRMSLTDAYRAALLALVGGQFIGLVMLLWSRRLPRDH
jgi:predicted MFS family arabinose efflux permease